MGSGADTDKHWRIWSKRDPYYAVLSNPVFRSDKLADNKDALFESGERHVADTLRWIEDGLGPVRGGRALDFGCGVGRVVLPLARRFDRVDGIDIAQPMLDEAKRNAERAGLDNIDLHTDLSAVEKNGATFDLVHTHLVLQHIPVDRGLALIERMLALTAPGGVTAIQVSLSRRKTFVPELIYRLRHDVPGMYVLANMVAGRPWFDPPMAMNEYGLLDILDRFESHGFPLPLIRGVRDGRVTSAAFYARR